MNMDEQKKYIVGDPYPGKTHNLRVRPVGQGKNRKSQNESNQETRLTPPGYFKSCQEEPN